MGIVSLVIIIFFGRRAILRPAPAQKQIIFIHPLSFIIIVLIHFYKKEYIIITAVNSWIIILQLSLVQSYDRHLLTAKPG